MPGLDRDHLTQLRRNISGQLLQAINSNPSIEGTKPLLALLDAIDERLDLQPHATIQQRQAIADKGPTTKPGGGLRGKRNAGTATMP